MNKNYLLLLCSCLVFALNAQRNVEFGFVAKAGTFTLPDREMQLTEIQNTRYYEKVSQKTYGGYLSRYGVFGAFRLGARMRVSAELLMGVGSAAIKTEAKYGPIYEERATALTFVSSHKFDLLDVSLPVKFHFSFKKEGKFSLMLGFGAARMVSSKLRLAYQFIHRPPYKLGEATRNGYEENLGNKAQIRFSLSTGCLYRLNKSTAIGVDFSGEPKFLNAFLIPDNARLSLFDPYALIDFTPNGMYSGSAIQQASVSVVVRHDILNK